MNGSDKILSPLKYLLKFWKVSEFKGLIILLMKVLLDNLKGLKIIISLILVEVLRSRDLKLRKPHKHILQIIKVKLLKNKDLLKMVMIRHYQR